MTEEQEMAILTAFIGKSNVSLIETLQRVRAEKRLKADKANLGKETAMFKPTPPETLKDLLQRVYNYGYLSGSAGEKKEFEASELMNPDDVDVEKFVAYIQSFKSEES